MKQFKRLDRVKMTSHPGYVTPKKPLIQDGHCGTVINPSVLAPGATAQSCYVAWDEHGLEPQFVVPDCLELVC